MKNFKKDFLSVEIYDTRAEMGAAAARDIRERLLALLAEKPTVNMIFAAAPSQNEVLSSLLGYSDIPWERVSAFHMDEYIGLPADAPQGFGNFLRDRLFDRAPFGCVHYINSAATDAEGECRRYAALLAAHISEKNRHGPVLY